jgi:YHS domain-containing protein
MKTMLCVMSAAVISLTLVATASADPYTLPNCPVTGQKLGSMGDPVVKEYEGREVKFCCAGCVGTFEADQAKYWKEIDKEIVTVQEEHYPTDTCVVLDEKLGSMGDPVKLVHNNRLVQFCCAGCVGTFKDDPDAYLKKLDKAVVEKQKNSYPLTTCVISGEELGSRGEPVDVVVANRLVRLCCEGCKAGLDKDPAAALKKLDKARKS